MKAGIIGLPGAGKTTLFQMATKIEPSGTGREPSIGVVPVPDKRFDILVDMYHPKKVTPATIEFVDGMDDTYSAKTELFSASFMDFIREADALIHVVRAFNDDRVPHIAGSVDPLRDAENLTSEMILTDLSLIERRLERIDKPEKGKQKISAAQLQTLKSTLIRLKEILENEGLVRSANLTPDEEESLVGLQFLTNKPMVAVVNIDESQIGQPDTPEIAKLREYLNTQGVSLIPVCAKVEAEIAQMGAEEEQQFLEAMGIEESGRTRLIRQVYAQCGLISYFTVGDPEVHAWTIHKNQNAVEAAGKIHTDIARGFIRAEVVAYDRIIEAGSWNAAKDKGFFRLEGRDYIVQDGDVMMFRFKV